LVPQLWQDRPVPEGHTIHRHARQQWAALRGAPVAVSSPQGRFTASAERLDGRVLRKIEPYGKHLFYWWQGGEVLHVHLGLFGKFWEQATTPAPAPRPSARVRMVGVAKLFDLTGPTECSLGGPEDRDRVVARLGPDPLRADADPAKAIARWRSSKAAIGKLLLDQSVVAGVGNVYRAEALYVNGIHPDRSGSSLSLEESEALWDTIRAMLRQGVRDGRIITVPRSELPRLRAETRRGETTYVYKREQCRRCATPIRRWEMANRWAYACPTCQT
jgi:endonuclease-8